MAQTLVKNYLHIIFSTKNRVKLIQPQFEKELHAYIGGVCNDLNCTVVIVGGYTDHIHILCMLSNNITLASLMQKIKSRSSRWIKRFLNPKLKAKIQLGASTSWGHTGFLWKQK